MHGPPAPEKIEKAKRAIEAWIKELEASGAASTSNNMAEDRK
jgi:hypothetical protein